MKYVLALVSAVFLVLFAVPINAGHCGFICAGDDTAPNVIDNLVRTYVTDRKNIAVNPLAGQSTGNPVPFDFTVNDPVCPAFRAELYRDITGMVAQCSGQTQSGGTLLTFSGAAVLGAFPLTYDWDISAIPNGLHMMAIQTYDAALNYESIDFNLYVDKIPPGGTFTPPATASGTVVLTVSATDQAGTGALHKADIYVGGVYAGTAAPIIAAFPYPPTATTAQVFTYNWDTTARANGPVTVQAIIYDQAGNTFIITPGAAVNINNILCGNGDPTDPGETCDDGAANGACPATCSATTCTLNNCNCNAGNTGNTCTGLTDIPADAWFCSKGVTESLPAPGFCCPTKTYWDGVTCVPTNECSLGAANYCGASALALPAQIATFASSATCVGIGASGFKPAGLSACCSIPGGKYGQPTYYDWQDAGGNNVGASIY